MTDWIKSLCLVACILLTGCSVFGPVKSEPGTAYLINTLPPASHSHYRGTTLFVMRPEANSLYDTPLMAYSTCRYQISYYSKNRWATTPAEMLQTLIVQTLQSSHAFRAVVTSPGIGQPEYALNTRIIELQQDFTRNPSVLRLTVRAQLIHIPSNRVVKTRQYDIVEVMPQKSPYGGVVAANRATVELLEDLQRFCRV